MRIALCQLNIEYLRYEKNIIRAEHFICEAARNHADCIVFPEMSFTGYSMDTAIISRWGKDACIAMQEIAVKAQIAIGFGWVCSAENRLAENHYSFIDRTGKMILDYVKIHPFSYAKENCFYQGGTSLPTADLCEIPFMNAICYDLRFPELFRILAKEVYAAFVPANWPAKRFSHWKTLLQARAIENQMYLIGINCVGDQDGILYSGGSMVIAPDGTILCDCKNDEGLFFTDISRDAVLTARESFPALRDMREELYKKL
ncbi:MAG: carbon-nitrogen family hydrolase [Ruminococcus sp.]|nr:carbon-nitrogen family hydrolase [Ruminococcus sp.]